MTQTSRSAMNIDTEELTALVLSFLTQSLKDNPSGFELRQFERLFPERTEEPPNWYERYGAKNTLEALRYADQKSIRISTNRNGSTFISLNTSSDKVDKHLVGLVVNQKSSSKRKRAPARASAQRCLDSFAINKGYSSAYNISRTNNRFRSRLNHDNSTQRSHQFVEKSPGPLSTPRQTIYKEQPLRAAPGDPRAGRQSSTQTVSPQVRPAPSFAGFGLPPSRQHSTTAFNTAQARRSSNSSSYLSQSSVLTPSSKPAQPIHIQEALKAYEARSSQQQLPPPRPIDPELEKRRALVKQRLLHLLTRKYNEIKTLYMSNLYETEFEEPLDPTLLGYKSLTELYKSFSDSIKIDYKGSMPTLSVIEIGGLEGKENITASDGNNRHGNNSSESGIASTDLNTSLSFNPSSEDKENTQSGRDRYKAIDPFNITTMLQSLEPLRQVKEPPLGNNKLEDVVKYRTMRIIFKSPKLTIRLSDWERKYQQEWNCSNKIQIRDYGFKTLLEFFKSLALELPIKIRLKDDQWIAMGDWNTLSEWLKTQVATGHYRAITVIDAKYEHIAYPGDKYSYLDYKNLQKQEYYPAIMMAVRSAHKMWLQMGDTHERVEDNISFETTSTCYDDYKRKGFFAIPDNFFKVGFPCAAFDESERRWCRAIIVEAPERIDDTIAISAHLVDYAVTKSFKRTNLLCILKNHMQQPVGHLQSTIN